MENAQSLIAFDAEHIKRYVFGISRLKEIRGASSLLDHLNRVEMVKAAAELKATKVYANGGAGLFVVASEHAEQLGQTVQKLYHEQTGGGASITYAIQPLPDYGDQDVMTVKMPDVLALLRWRLRAAKSSQGVGEDLSGEKNVSCLAPPTHPFFSFCHSCGIAYAEELQKDSDDPGEEEHGYCQVCLKKQQEDHKVKDSISMTLQSRPSSPRTLWERILKILDEHHYNLSARPERPNDFDAFATFSSSKACLGLIYADANGMGKALEKQMTLQQVHDFAQEVDQAVFDAMGLAIAQHLPVQNGVFPFDILLIGGDDIVIVVPATKAMQVACTIAQAFHEKTEQKYTLSVGVTLAPIKYPFHLQRILTEETLQAAKKAGSASTQSESEQTRVNFVTITGSTSLSYKKISQELQRKNLPNGIQDEFYATLRPYTLTQLEKLLTLLQEKRARQLGRTKLHQLRAAILKLNRTSTILEALSALRNWKSTELTMIVDIMAAFTLSSPEQARAETLFPWYREKNTSIYRTPLLDFIELYDFVLAEEGGIKG